MTAVTPRPFAIGVAISTTEAPTPEEANRLAKASPAYRQILEKYPKEQFDREYRQTSTNTQSGFWFVEFTVTPKPE